jgi:alkaline phosphatase D
MTSPRIHLIPLAFSLLGLSPAAGDEPANPKEIRVIQFGSCIKQDLPTPIFQRMLRDRADLILFLGDNIYADTDDMAVMRSKYAALTANREFQQLRQAGTALATWDDHDYGVNDGGADFSAKASAEGEFLRFWGDAPDSRRRHREGVYDAHLFGPAGRRVQVILLDTRYFRSPLKKGEPRVGGPYVPDDDGTKTMLGRVQWRWLEEQLRMPAELRIIVSSIQFVAQAAGQETWSNLPAERTRMLDLIRRTRASGVVFVSGDRHWAELSKTDAGYPIYDLTSSSFNQKHARGTPTENQHRATDRTYHQENYGVISVDWEATDPAIEMRIIGIDGEIAIRLSIALSDLQFARP